MYGLVEASMFLLFCSRVLLAMQTETIAVKAVTTDNARLIQEVAGIEVSDDELISAEASSVSKSMGFVLSV